MKISNKSAQSFVQNRKEFQGSNTFSVSWKGMYIVYSYGMHFPLFVYDPAIGWFENADRYSVTTSKHRSQLRPCEETIKTDTVTLQNKIK